MTKLLISAVLGLSILAAAVGISSVAKHFATSAPVPPSPWVTATSAPVPPSPW
jgi:hypothetical protein